MHFVARSFLIAWASPNTLLGASLGAIGLLMGARVQFRRGVLEFYGGGVRWGLARFATAITFGHTILGLDEDSLDRCREHEHVHVRQYERWGPFFLPAYVLCWFVLRVRGRDGYRENPFERQAYGETEIG